ncbi:polyprenyl synthetase family protein [Candidatus Bandiella euplotis]|uniref:polyprenyl synthetase family protein n=1 Tax=Candidatus Bandiella euplotis TaxID=1664265 RepID=UPI002B257368|nr:polyprenyl synthetase family protein [Candidatus Bandiella woodruffii]
MTAKFTNDLATELSKLDSILLGVSSSNKTQLLNQIANHIVSSGGKRIRPLLTIAIAKLFLTDEVIMNKVLMLASAIEFIHTATLLHDDVVDNGDMRRNHITANYVWGNKPSILVGDFLFSQSFEQMVKTENLKVLEILARTSAKIAEAEVWQLDIVGKLDLLFSDYIDLISAKTADLFAAACECSAILANADEKQIKSLRNFGLNLGIIFQINDDISDYFSNISRLGKKAGNDFFENKITLPVILLLEKAASDDLAVIHNLLAAENKTSLDLTKLLNYFEKYSIKEESYAVSNQFITKGIKNLEIIPDSAVKGMLFDLIATYKKSF